MGDMNLSAAEESALIAKWIKIGLDAGPSDDSAIRGAVSAAYKNAELAEVPVVIVSSPFALGYVVGYLQAEGVGEPMLNAPEYLVEACAALKTAFPEEPCKPLKWRKAEYINTLDGQYESGFLASCEAFELLGLSINQNEIDPFIALANNSCAWVAGEYCAVVCRRAISRKLDAVGNLHCTDGPCMEWLDGQKLYAVHGVWVNEDDVMHANLLSADYIKKEPNAEVRQALMLLAGSEKILKELGATEIDRSGSGVDEIALYGMPNTGSSSLLEVVDHTPESIDASEGGLRKVGSRAHRVYFLRVPSSCRTAAEGVAGLVGLPADLYGPVRES